MIVTFFLSQFYTSLAAVVEQTDSIVKQHIFLSLSVFAYRNTFSICHLSAYLVCAHTSFYCPCTHKKIGIGCCCCYSYTGCLFLCRIAVWWKNIFFKFHAFFNHRVKNRTFVGLGNSWLIIFSWLCILCILCTMYFLHIFFKLI